MRARSLNPNAVASQSMALGPSWYAIIGITAGYSDMYLSLDRLGGMVFAPYPAQHGAALADGDVVGESGLEWHHEVVGAAGRSLDAGQVARDDGLIAAGTQPFQSARLGGLLTGSDLRDLDLVLAVSGIAVDSHDDAVTGFDASLEPIGALRDPALGPPRFDAFHRAAELVDLGHDRQRLLLDAIGEVFHVVRPSQRVGDLRHGRLMADHLLRAQCQLGGVLGRQSERFVISVRVQRLGASEDCAHRLERGPHDIGEGLLRRERHAPRLRVEPQRQRALVFGAE